MRTIARSLAGTVAGLFLAGSAGAAESPGRCTHESWTVDGLPLTATVCAPPERNAHVAVSETFTRGGQSMSRTVDLEIVRDVEVTRAVDTVPLGDVGSAKQLHLTLVYRSGEASIEHALVLPGAVVLK